MAHHIASQGVTVTVASHVTSRHTPFKGVTGVTLQSATGLVTE
jgi:hypothetical protein